MDDATLTSELTGGDLWPLSVKTFLFEEPEMPRSLAVASLSESELGQILSMSSLRICMLFELCNRIMTDVLAAP